MSLREVNLIPVTIKQYQYKLKGYSGLVYSFILTQLLGLFFSLTPRAGMSSGNGVMRVSVNTFSTDTVLFFTFVWIIIVSALLTSKTYRNIEFSLVSNWVSSTLSNIFLLLTLSVFAGVSSTLLSFLLRFILIFTSEQSLILLEGVKIAPLDFLIGMLASTLYMILLSSITFLVRIIYELNSKFALILAAALIFINNTYSAFFGNAFRFFTTESSLGLFTLKILATTILLFGLSLHLSNRMEVPR